MNPLGPRPPASWPGLIGAVALPILTAIAGWSLVELVNVGKSVSAITATVADDHDRVVRLENCLILGNCYAYKATPHRSTQ